MTDATMTITGNLTDEPRLNRVANGHAVTNFRVASTRSYFDREKQQWVDSDTLFVNVSAWRALAENVADSLHKGDPVVVTGRLTQREYVLNEQARTVYELQASNVGHDLTRGTTRFARKTRSGPVMEVVLDDDGLPADPGELRAASDGADDGEAPAAGVPANVDPATGEVRELAGVS